MEVRAELSHDSNNIMLFLDNDMADLDPEAAATLARELTDLATRAKNRKPPAPKRITNDEMGLAGGKGNESFLECGHVDAQNIYVGGCEILATDIDKIITWLKAAKKYLEVK